jgi:hypothetical protein
MSGQQNDRMEDKPARLTVLIDADKKKAFEALCASQDITASQVVRQLIREYLSKHGVDYAPAGHGE